MVTLFSKPGCQPCKGTKHALDKKQIAYVERDVTTDPDAADAVVSADYRAEAEAALRPAAWRVYLATVYPAVLAALLGERVGWQVLFVVGGVVPLLVAAFAAHPD